VKNRSGDRMGMEEGLVFRGGNNDPSKGQ